METKAQQDARCLPAISPLLISSDSAIVPAGYVPVGGRSTGIYPRRVVLRSVGACSFVRSASAAVGRATMSYRPGMVKADLAEVLAQLSGGSVPKDSTAFAAQFCAAYRQGAEQHNLPTLVHNSGREVEGNSDATRCHLGCRYSGLQLTHASFYTRSCTPSTLEGALMYLGRWIFNWVREHDADISNLAHKVPVAPGLGALAEAAAAAAVPPQRSSPPPHVRWFEHHHSIHCASQIGLTPHGTPWVLQHLCCASVLSAASLRFAG